MREFYLWKKKIFSTPIGFGVAWGRYHVTWAAGRCKARAYCVRHFARNATGSLAGASEFCFFVEFFLIPKNKIKDGPQKNQQSKGITCSLNVFLWCEACDLAGKTCSRVCDLQWRRMVTRQELHQLSFALVITSREWPRDLPKLFFYTWLSCLGFGG